MLVELGVVEQRYRAVTEMLEGASVTEVARRNGVVRQTVHKWLRRYAAGGIGALADGSCRPASCPHQMAPQVEARVVALRREHPRWGPAPTWTCGVCASPDGDATVSRCYLLSTGRTLICSTASPRP